MRSPILWVIIAVLAGISVFGIYKSLELVTKNAVLNHSLSLLKVELNKTQFSLNASRQALGESYLKNAELEGRLAEMDKKLEKQAMDIKAYLGKISTLSEKLRETARANASLSAENKGITNQFLRVKLESQEMRNKLSSIAELKKAIKELKVKIRQDSRLKKAQAEGQKKREKKGPVLRFPEQLPEQKEMVEELIEGNEGFLIKDGRSTFEGLVDIRVVPAESATAR